MLPTELFKAKNTLSIWDPIPMGALEDEYLKIRSYKPRERCEIY